MSSVGSQRRRGVAALAAVGLFGGLLTVAGVASPTVSAAPTELFFSEYVEGTSNNKALEIFNGTGATIDLAAQGYSIQQFSNGNTSPSATVNLTGSVADGDVYVLAHSSAVADVTAVADQTTGVGLFNGNDAVVLRKGTTLLDVIGQIGVDPGNEWGTGDTSTMDNTLRRLTDVCAGDPDGTDVFDPAVEWTGFPTNTFGGLGTHAVNCSDNGGGGDVALVINEIDYDQQSTDDAEFVEIHNPGTDAVDVAGFTVELVNGNGGAIYQTIGLAGSIPAGGYYVLCSDAATVPNCDDASVSSIQNGAPDAVGLRDDEGELLDAVSYEGDVPGYTEGSGAGLEDTSADGVGLSRCPDGADTDSNNVDLLGGRPVTPGAANDCSQDPDPPQIAFIHQVQGSGSAVAITGTVAVEAVVTSLFTRDDVLDGFFLQEEDADADLDPATSEGIFVFCRGACPGSLAVGDLVAVTGDAEEFFGMSQIDASGGSISTISSGNPIPSPSPVLLPASGSTLAEGTFEPLEGMVVTFPDELVVSEYFQLARFGQVVLTETSRPAQFTQTDLPSVTGYDAFLEDLATRRIILDDDNNDNNDAISDGPDEPYAYPGGGLSLTSRFRGGDTIEGLTGVLHWSFAGSSGTDAWRVRPIQLTGSEDLYTFDPANPAPPAPDAVGGSLTVASFNVLNYFASIDDGIGTCAPSGTEECRGADSTSELDRQRDKIVDALATIDGDIVGLIELENDGDDASIADLVAGLNARVGAGTYDYVETGFIGDDAIKVGLIYQPANVSPYNDFAILDSSVDPTFDDMLNRPMLVQTFVENASGERVTVAVNHLKSKGSACDGVGDPDLGDGQGNCSATRTAAASAIAGYLASDPTGSGDPDSIVLGDLNSYAMEDPIRALESEGYTDLLEAFGASGAYSYLFDGQLGTLDYAMANSSLSDQVTGATAWNINADEIPVFDYNDEIEDSGEASFERESDALAIFAPDALRSSDHDPVIVGLALDSIPDDPTCHGEAATIVGTPGDDVIDGGNGKDVIVTFGGHDTVTGGNGKDVICTGFGDDVIDGGNGMDLLDGGEGNDVIDGGNGRDTCLAGESLVACEIS